MDRKGSNVGIECPRSMKRKERGGRSPPLSTFYQEENKSKTKNQKAMKETLGGKRLHDGSKMEVDMHPYKGATHNLSKRVRTPTTTGVTTPVYMNVLTPGDKVSMNIRSAIRTLPTIGPMFGKFEYCVDVFTVRLSLYNKLFHNNRTSIARNMQSVYFPTMTIHGPNPATTALRQAALTNANALQIGQDSLMAYLGVRGIGHAVEVFAGETKEVEATVNALGMLAYYDINKEFYANKQEELMWVVDMKIEEAASIAAAWTTYGEPIASLGQARMRIPSGGIFGGVGLAGSGLRLRADGTHGLIVNEYVESSDVPNEVTYQFIPSMNGWGWPLSNGTALTYSHVDNVQTMWGNEIAVLKTEGAEDMTNVFVTFKTDGGASTKTSAKLQSFPMENIEKMRDAILAAPGDVPFDTSRALMAGAESRPIYEANLPYSMAQFRLNTLTSLDREHVLDGQTPMVGRMAGLCLKTYKADRFNAWLNTEFVESLTEAVRVDTADGYLVLNELNTAEKLYNIESRIAATNQTFKGWIRAVYGINPDIASEMPIFRGSAMGDITFDEVISNSANAETGEPLGTLAGRGVLDGGSGTIHIQVDEPSIVMAIAHITPIIGYSQGNQWFTRLKTIDDLHKPEYDGIGYQPLITDELAAWSTWRKSAEQPEDVYRSIGKQVAWAEYMTATDENFGDFSAGGTLNYMVLDRDYEALGEASESIDFSIKDATTYIDPRKHNYAFASTKLDAQNFWLHIQFDVKAHRKVAAKQIPRL